MSSENGERGSELSLVATSDVAVGAGYKLLALSDSRTYWVRLGNARSGALLRFWSKPVDNTSPEELNRFMRLVADRLLGSSGRDLETHAAMTIFESGWDFWPGIPHPIADLLASEESRTKLLEWAHD